MKIFTLVLPTILALLCASAAQADESEAVKKCLAKKETLERDYDASVGDLYTDTALLKHIKTAPDGTKTEKTLTGEKYKRILPQIMPLAKEAKDVTTLEEIVVKAVNAKEGVYAVNAIRYSSLKNNKAPYKGKVMIGAKGKCQIVEEITYSQ